MIKPGAGAPRADSAALTGGFALVLKHAGMLLSGNAVGSVLGLASLLLAARHLGVDTFGTLVLVQTYTLVIDRLINFQSWQAFIKFAAEADAAGDRTRLNLLLKRLVLLDIASAAAGTVVALAGLGIAARVFDWGAGTIGIAAMFCFSILFNLTGVPTGVLRHFNRFDYLAVHGIVASTVKLTAVLIAIGLGTGLLGMAVAWLVAELLKHLSLVVASLAVLRQNGLLSFWRVTLERVEGLWSFVWNTNLLSAVRMASAELDVLIVGAVLGAAPVALYKLAKQFGSILLKVTDPLYVSLYPELARQRASNDRQAFNRLVGRSAVFAGAIGAASWVVFAVAGRQLLVLVLDQQYVGVYDVLMPYLLAVAIALATLPLQPAMLAFGRPGLSTVILAVSTVVYLAMLVPLLDRLGVIGASVAYILFYVLWGGLMVAGTIQLERRWQLEMAG